jgi:two-component sensor histidine kinase/ligand-binding sensor protein
MDDSDVGEATRSNERAFSDGEETDNIKLTPELVAQLLDPAAWEGVLDLYASSMKLAIALVNADGRLVGPCHNPQPIWTLARRAKPASIGACLFCLETTPSCSAGLDACRTNSMVLAHDQAGFAHVTIPLTLGDRPVGALLAGQILDRYPESLSLQRFARAFGLSSQLVWHMARQQPPLGLANLTVYGKLLSSLSQTFLANRYGAILETKSKARTKALNQQLRRSLAEKETLLREVHHRVKNNLQIISSLLNMQGSSLTDQNAVAALQDSRARVLSMAVIHEQLYGHDQWDAIDFEEYAKTLVAELLYSFGERAGGVISRFKTSRVLLNVEQAIPCGLILTELITNVLKYAYPTGGGGEVLIELSETPSGLVTLTVSDCGVGLPRDFDQENPKSMGLEMIGILASQLGGALTVEASPGARFCVEFPRETKDGNFTV